MKLLWCDLETTGLQPNKDKILEVAWAVATLEDPFTIGEVEARVVALSSSIVLDAFIADMHNKNGLLAECMRGGVDVSRVEEQLLEVVPEPQPGDDYSERPTLAGASVHFDLGFLRAHMPTLAARLSHRVYDTSAIKLFCRSLGMPKPPKEEAHRAAPDVLEAVAHAKLCAEWLGWWPGATHPSHWASHWLPSEGPP